MKKYEDDIDRKMMNNLSNYKASKHQLNQKQQKKTKKLSLIKREQDSRRSFEQERKKL